MSIASPAPIPTETLGGTSTDNEPVAKKRKKDVAPTTGDRRRFANVSYWAIGWLTMAHLVAFTAPWTFTWRHLR